MSAVRRPTIVCFSNLDWGFLRYRKQHLMERLSRHYPVVYVNPPRAAKWRAFRTQNRVAHPAADLWVYEPLVLPGVRHHPRIKRLNDRLIAVRLRRLPVLDRQRITWVYSPHARRFIDLLAPSFVVYDMADDYTAPSGPVVRDNQERHELSWLDRLERQVLERADLVFAVSPPLAAKAEAVASDVHLVPNGADIDRYPAVLAHRPRSGRPKIGYVGSIAPRFDVALVANLARAHPEWDFEMVGPVSGLSDISGTASQRNLRWSGEIPYDEVPHRIATFDVAILPLLEIPFAYQCSPIQVYDYLAAGRPVVSTPVAQLESIPHLVSIARGPERFGAAIAEALANDTPEARTARRAFATANSWSARVDAIRTVLESRLARTREQAA